MDDVHICTSISFMLLKESQEPAGMSVGVKGANQSKKKPRRERALRDGEIKNDQKR